MRLLLSNILMVLSLFAVPGAMSQKMAIEPYVTGLDIPMDVKNCGDNRLFVACQGGQIRVIDADGTLRPVPFLDISSKVHAAGEDGLLGMAFSPNYKTDGKFYLDYIGFVGGQIATYIEQYSVSTADSNVADLSSALTIITQLQPGNAHVGGNIMFGKDGYLYINLGDGVEANDSLHAGQDVTTLLGKILRIDVTNSSFSQPYAIPSTNQFYNDPTPGIRKEIWAVGVRNPWRSSMDKFTGDLWIADVGELNVEEIDYQANNASSGTLNFGWSIVEGDSCYNPSSACNKTGITMPIYEYLHNGAAACVIGGYVWRSVQSKALFGTYIFTDWVLKWIKGFRQTGGAVSGSVTTFMTASQLQGRPISFGEDWMGDQYILFSSSGTVFKISDTSSQRHPKAYYTSIDLGGGTSYLLQGLQGKNLTYQWLKNNVPVTGATSPDYNVTDSGNYSLVVTNDLGFTDTSDLFSYRASPLDLISFRAQKTMSGAIALKWETTYELNIEGYNILRKQDNETDFSKIGFVGSQSVNGLSTTELDYHFTDSSTTNYRKRFYRLQIVHADGSFTYSNIVYVSSDPAKNGYLIFPNPAHGQVQLYLNQYTAPVIMTLYDNTGKEVRRQTITQQTSTIDLPASKGVYIIEVSDKEGSNKVRKKLVVD